MDRAATEGGIVRDLPKLSPMARRVVELVVEGHSVKVVAGMVRLSQATVNYHLRRAAVVWGLDRSRNLRVQLARRVAEDSLTQLLIARADALHDTALVHSPADDDELALSEFLAPLHDPALKQSIRRAVDRHTGAARHAAIRAIRETRRARLGPAVQSALVERYAAAIAQAVANVAEESSPTEKKPA